MSEVRAELCGVLGVQSKRLYELQAVRVGQAHTINPRTLVWMADYFGCSIDDLFNPVAREILVHKVVVA